MHTKYTALETCFLTDALLNHNNAMILARLPELELPQSALVAGCLYQVVWNVKSGHAPTHAIKDYDIFYFDAADLSEAAERKVQHEAEILFKDLNITVDVCNQARVHHWYESYFGLPYAALGSTAEGISKFLVECTCVGIAVDADSKQRLHAPYGLEDLYAGILKPNARCNHRQLFDAKAGSYQSRWPWLKMQAD